MVLLPCSTCCATVPDSTICPTACNENYSQVVVNVYNAGSAGGYHFQGLDSISGFTPRQCIVPAVNTAIVIDRYGTGGILIAPGKYFGYQSFGSTDDYEQDIRWYMTRGSDGSVCRIEVLAILETHPFGAGAGYDDRSQLYADIRLTRDTGFKYDINFSWIGMPTNNYGANSKSKSYDVFPSPSSGIKVDCGSLLPERLSGQSGSGPEGYGGSYGIGGLKTTDDSPPKRWEASYYRKAAPWSVVVRYQ